MKTFARRLLASMIAGGLMTVSIPAKAVDFSVQPRLEAGLLYYKYEQSSGTDSVFGLGRTTFGEFDWKDTLPYLGVGATAFVDRFFFDVSALRAFSGEAEDNQTNSTSNDAGPDRPASVVVISRDDDVDFSRNEFGLSAGYAITDNLSIFAGYKWAETDFNSDFTGNFQIDAFTPEAVRIVGIPTGKLKLDVKQKGPFLGVSYGWNINQGFLDGVLTANVAVAFLDSEVKLRLSNQVFTPTSPPIPAFRLENTRDSFDGDSIGLTFGVNWRGFTGVQGLTYLVGVQAYSYDFDSNETSGEFTETAINFKAGMAYSF